MNDIQVMRLAEDLEACHKRNIDMINRRVKVEQLLLDIANGKRPLPTQQECRAMAEHLGVPSEFHNLSKGF